LTLRRFQQFVAVAEEKQFLRAAKRLNMAQPPLSNAIQSLEEELGVQLFIRNSRSVELSDAGVAFLAEIRLALSQVDFAKTVANRIAQGFLGHLKIASIFSSSVSLIPEILPQFRNKFPDINLELQVMPGDEQCTAISEGIVDIGFLRKDQLNLTTFDSEKLTFEPLWMDRMIVALPKNHCLTKSKKLNLLQLKDESFILPLSRRGRNSTASVFHSQILNACKESGFMPKILQEAPLRSMISLVSGELGIALLPGPLKKLGWPGITFKTLSDDSPFLQLEFGMAWLKKNQSPFLPGIINLARKTKLTS